MCVESGGLFKVIPHSPELKVEVVNVVVAAAAASCLLQLLFYLLYMPIYMLYKTDLLSAVENRNVAVRSVYIYIYV